MTPTTTTGIDINNWCIDIRSYEKHELLPKFKELLNKLVKGGFRYTWNYYGLINGLADGWLTLTPPQLIPIEQACHILEFGKAINIHENEFSLSDGKQSITNPNSIVFLQYPDERTPKHVPYSNNKIPLSEFCRQVELNKAVWAEWEKKDIGIDDKQGSYKDLTFNFCEECGDVTNVDLS